MTGPVARGDVATVRAHLAALEAAGVSEPVRRAHAAVSLLAVELVRRREGADLAALDELEELLGRALDG